MKSYVEKPILLQIYNSTSEKVVFLSSRKIKFARPSINDKGAWGQYCKSTFFRSTVNSVPKMFAEIYVGAMQLNVDSVASGAV